MKISIVIPVYKSAKTLPELHQRISSVASEQNWNCDIVYVNDASPDQSMSVLQALPRSIPFQIINLKTNLGQSCALLVGMSFCAGDIIACMDADLQDEPEFLPEMIRAFDSPFDVTFASRSGRYESGVRLVTSFIFKSLVSFFSNGRIPRHAGLFFMIRKSAAAALKAYLPQSPYLIGLIARERLACTSITVERSRNKLDETSYTFKKRLKVAGSFFSTLRMMPLSNEKEIKAWIADRTSSMIVLTD